MFGCSRSQFTGLVASFA